MKAIAYSKFGPPDVLELTELPVPTPKAGEVLVKVRAAAVNPLDWHFVRGEPSLMRLMGKPDKRIPGVDVAGEIAAIGAGVAELRVGDEVFGSCDGACAEYACAREDRLVRKPPRLSFEQAAAIPGAACTALMALRDYGGLRPGQSVLVNGAAGGIGTFAVQIAKALGADVTGVCSPRNVEHVRSLGADHVVGGADASKLCRDVRCEAGSPCDQPAADKTGVTRHCRWRRRAVQNTCRPNTNERRWGYRRTTSGSWPRTLTITACSSGHCSATSIGS